MIEKNELIEIGKFFKPHGLKGELNVQLDYPSEILDCEHPLIVDMEGLWVPFYPSGCRSKGEFSSLVTIEGIDSKEKAVQFVNKLIFMRKSDLAEVLGIDPDELENETDLTGYTIHDKTEGEIGIIRDIDDSTANVLLLVENINGENIYIPFNDEFVLEIDDDSKRIEVDLPSGIIDLNK